VAGDGHPVVLVTALARDEPGELLASLLSDAGVEVFDLGLAGPTPEKVRVRAGGRTLLRLDRGGSPSPVRGGPGGVDDAELRSAGAVLVADYGRGVAAHGAVRRALTELPPRLPLVWDPHPRGPSPVPGARLATPNQREAASFVPEVAGSSLAAHTARARALARRWNAASVAITLGGTGALLAAGDVPPLVVPAPPASGDACGAGDRFAAAAAELLADGALPSEAVSGAVRSASAFVAGNGAAGAAWPRTRGGDAHWGRARRGARPDADVVVAATRARGGTVVAAGGCFDLLHAGHVRTLAAARALGDCLVVCLNSDASVARLKGPGRPLVPEADRAAVLLGLACVDAIAVFDDDTPVALLERLQPDVFAKGADYSLSDLPEAEVLARWGGQAVVLPFLEGRSTSRMLEEVARRGA
jgi:rfaE bifunctional protein nucleotidyltransferase chain/domain